MHWRSFDLSLTEFPCSLCLIGPFIYLLLVMVFVEKTEGDQNDHGPSDLRKSNDRVGLGFTMGSPKTLADCDLHLSSYFVLCD